MAEQCLNCSETITANFCSNCGQKKFKRIDKKYIWDELQYTVFHTNKGLLYSLKQLVKNPGKTAREFISGNRVNHYKPILLLFVLSGISTFLSYKVLNFRTIMETYFAKQQMNTGFMNDFMSLISSYNALFMLMLVPLFALTTKIAFRSWGHNYYEHLVMNTYILSFYTILNIVLLYPVMFFYRHNPDTFFSLTQYAFIAVPFMLVLFFKTFYYEKPLKAVLLRVLGVLGLTAAGYMLFIIIAVVAGIIIAISQGGPEALQYFKKQ
jgi:hypothetical protein